MDKYLHKGIGEQFRDEINSLSRKPRKHIWENIDKQLDKTDVKNYKEKIERLKKRTMLLLLLLIGISTFLVVYFNTTKNNNNSLTKQIIKEPANTNERDVHITTKQEPLITNEFKQREVTDGNIATGIVATNVDQNLFIAGKLPIEIKGKTKTKIIAGTIAEDEISGENEIEKNKIHVLQNPVKTGVVEVVTKPGEAEQKNTAISGPAKKDSLTLNGINPLLKKDKKNQFNNVSRFTLTAFAAPDYSAYRLVNDKYNSYDDKTGIAKREQSDISFSAGILLGYKASSKITIQSGIIYSSSNISISPTKIYAEKNNDGIIKYRYNTSFGYGYLLPSFSVSPSVGDSLFANGANHTLHYISIPVIIKYKFGNKKITFHPGIGFTFNFLTKATLTTDVEDQFNRETEYVTKLESIKKFGFSLMLTPELQYQLSKKWSISAMPYFKYSLGSINRNNIVKTYPYTFALGVGVIYKF